MSNVAFDKKFDDKLVTFCEKSDLAKLLEEDQSTKQVSNELKIALLHTFTCMAEALKANKALKLRDASAALDIEEMKVAEPDSKKTEESKADEKASEALNLKSEKDEEKKEIKEEVMDTDEEKKDK